MGLDIMVLWIRSSLDGGGVFSYRRKGGRGQAGQRGGGSGVGGNVFTSVFAFTRSEAGLAAVADLLQLSVNTVGLVEFDTDLKRRPLAIGT